MNPKPNRHGKTISKATDSVKVEVSHLSLNNRARILDNDKVKQLFVAYRFLGIDPEELETFSLPKPQANIPIAYNFTKTFQVDIQKNYERRQYLAAMLLPDDPEHGRISFTLVSDPDDDIDADCEEIGVAFVDVREILRSKKDVEEQNINLHSVKNEKEVIGTLNVTVKCLAALEAVEKEMKIEEKMKEGISKKQKHKGKTIPRPQPCLKTKKENSINLQMKSVNEEADSVTVVISHLSLNENANVLGNGNVKNLFVAYNFLGIDPAELETPFSLPKPKANIPIAFNFTKTFRVDMQKNYERRQYLASMLLKVQNDPEQGRIRFTVVTDPDDDIDMDCEDIGEAFVDVKEILVSKKDVEGQDFNIHAVKNKKEVIGTLNVTVKCLAVLEAVEKEMMIKEAKDKGETEKHGGSLRQTQSSHQTEAGGISNTLQLETDSEDNSDIDVMNPKPKRRDKVSNNASDRVTISISHLSLKENAHVLGNDKFKQLFVAYSFLGIDPEQLETFSLPKPKANIPIAYNFTKTFQVDMQKNYERRQYLAAMLLPDDPEQGRIRFTIVSEPPDDDMDAECQDVGVAFVDVKEILRSRKNFEEVIIDVHDVKNEKEVIGTLDVTVKCLGALEAVEKEMKINETK